MQRRHATRKIVGLLAFLLFIPAALGSRSYIADSEIDLTQYIASAPFTFRGHVVSVTKTSKSFPTNAVARFKVDRWYRGSVRSNLSIHFSIGIGRSGDCIQFAFAPNTYWLVFAKEKNGQLEPVDSCGAVAISPVLGPNLKNADPTAQLEADLIAGLQDRGQGGRIFTIQRLGGLKSPSSVPALHRIIEGPNPNEAKWAAYAALRT